VNFSGEIGVMNMCNFPVNYIDPVLL